MNNQILQLIQSFESDSTKPKEKFDQFLMHVYFTFDKKSRNIKSEKIKNKYKEIKKSVLGYIIAHKAEIIRELK